MGCFSFGSSKTPSSMKASSSSSTSEGVGENSQPKNLRQEILLQIPGCRVHLMDEGEAVELLSGEFMLLRIFDQDICLATIVKVGEDLQWPLTKDEPVVKLDSLSYLFTLPMKDGDPLSYGVSFPEHYGGSLGSLDSFLKEHSCFTGLTSNKSKGVDWKEFAPRVEDYNNFLAKAIAGGTGQIVKGIFKCSNAYTNQVQKGGEMTLAGGSEYGNGVTRKANDSSIKNSGTTKKSGLNKNLKRVKKLSKMTEKLSKAMLDGVGVATGAVMAPVVKSKAGKAFLSMVPGEVLLASLDAVNIVLDAVEVAEKQAFSATSTATTRMVSNSV
ncbi:senescence/dehydration-associated protein At4g35985, chloroplastic isoform X2 [Ziziphus jujuba]|uniref:Senescence/dehydration-associated protein At4g35985, chloroplastic isoform X2 n=1 Tax=Ziziphus jujuba TaxID=326968 RepID=A0A6P4A631_ZIZJJ|nr:senescence/dehydration-associated protein At4g35985, chloroplastic isoform X2 [Ziziphus jujuba]